MVNSKINFLDEKKKAFPDEIVETKVNEKGSTPLPRSLPPREGRYGVECERLLKRWVKGV